MRNVLRVLIYFLIYFLICLVKINVSREDLFEGELCAANDKPGSNSITHFKVEVAFKSYEYLGLIGKMWRNNETEPQTSNVALRVMYWHQPDPSGKAPDHYYSARLWYDLLPI